MKSFICLFFLLISTYLSAQNLSNVHLSGYLEAYYCYDFGNPVNHSRPYMYSFNQHNELNLNLGYIKLGYDNNNVRANLAMMVGTYTQANLASEPDALKNIYEGNMGVKMAKKKNIWLDAGVFASHIGFEGAVGKDCWTLSRNIASEYSPYYEAGAKISYTSDNEKLILAGFLLNGWQHIHRPDGNNTPALGVQVQYKPHKNFTFNYSNFIGNDKPDSAAQMRYFHNFYLISQLTEKTGITLGFDIGQEQKRIEKTKYNIWYSPLVIVRQAIGQKSFLAARVEYYRDMQNVIIDTSPANVKGFRTLGYSTNFDYHYNSNLLCRIEARFLHSRDALFLFNRQPSTYSLFFTTSLAVAF